MDKKKRTGNRKIGTIAIVALVAITFIILSLAIMYLLVEIKKLDEDTEIKTALNETYKSMNEYVSNKNSNLLRELDLYNNIDTKLEEIKSEYWSNLKTFETQVINRQVDYKIAYITFDDGPYYLTNSILNLLDRYDVKVTFFTIGLDKDICFDNPNASCAGMYAEEARRGHVVANHTYSHLIYGGLYNSGASFMDQVNKQANLIKSRTGQTTKIVRFPGGSGTAAYIGVKDSAIAYLRKNGYGYVDWTAADGDGGNPGNTTQAFNTFKASIDSNVEVVLFHDYSTVTYAILPQVIEYLRNNNYVLLPLFYESAMVNK